MPVEFLSGEEASAYRGVPSQSDLEKLFFLAADRQLIAKRRGAAHSRSLGMPCACHRAGGVRHLWYQPSGAPACG